MATKAQSSKGIRLGVEATIGGVSKIWYFNEVKTTPAIGQSPQKIDVTHLTSESHEYVKDIPDFSGDLSFTMNAQPFKSTISDVSESNLNLIRALNQSSAYNWIIEYPQLNQRIVINADWTFEYGAGAVSSAIEVTLTLIPRGAPNFTAFTVTTVTLSYNANSGTGTMSSTSLNIGDTATAPTCTFTAPDTKIFGSWNTASDGSGQTYDEGDTFTILADTTLYAIWVNAGA